MLFESNFVFLSAEWLDVLPYVFLSGVDWNEGCCWTFSLSAEVVFDAEHLHETITDLKKKS